MSGTNPTPTPEQIAALPPQLRQQFQNGTYTPPPPDPKPTFATTTLPKLGMVAPFVLVALGLLLGIAGRHFGWW